MENINTFWNFLEHSPLFWLTITIVIFYFAGRIQLFFKGHPMFNPVLLSILAVVFILWVSNTPYKTYFNGARFIHFLLGPATVALAIPLYEQTGKLKKMALPLSISLLAGSSFAILSAVLIGRLLGASHATLLSLAPKSVTTPIAMGIAEKIGGLPSLTAVLVIVTGIIGAVGGETLLKGISVRDHSIQGFAIGLSSHGIGTAAAFEISNQAGAFSGLGMGLNGALTAFLVPALVKILF